MEAVLGLLIGVGLSAACGFRVFVPLLVVSLGAYTGHVHLAPGFGWIGTTPALVAFTVATCCEILGYFIPWLDHALDVLSVPLAIIAGTVLTAGFITELSPFLRWTLAVIAGGAVAGGIRSALAGVRVASTSTTAGMANPLISAVEGAVSAGLATLSLVVPVLAIILVLILAAVLGRPIVRFLGRARRRASGKAMPHCVEPEDPDVMGNAPLRP